MRIYATNTEKQIVAREQQRFVDMVDEPVKVRYTDDSPLAECIYDQVACNLMQENRVTQGVVIDRRLELQNLILAIWTLKRARDWVHFPLSRDILWK